MNPVILTACAAFGIFIAYVAAVLAIGSRKAPAQALWFCAALGLTGIALLVLSVAGLVEVAR